MNIYYAIGVVKVIHVCQNMVRHQGWHMLNIYYLGATMRNIPIDVDTFMCGDDHVEEVRNGADAHDHPNMFERSKSNTNILLY